MKRVLAGLLMLSVAMLIAQPSISYVTKEYVHDATKVSGLPSAGSLLSLAPVDLIGKGLIGTTTPVTFHRLVGKVGEVIHCPIVIDASEGIKSIENACVAIENPPQDLTVSPVLIGHYVPFKENVRSHMMVISATIPKQIMNVEYSITINGVEIKLPLALIPTNSQN